jgi:AhpD family alkylhydroperoxidase
MTVSTVERDQADAATLAFYDRAEERFKALLNIFKVFGHHPEYGTVFTDLVMAILKDGELDWLTKELLILKATQRNECQYCVVQHERVSEMLGMEADKIADEDANRIPKELWERVHAHWSEPQIVEAVFTITTYIMVSKFGDALGVELEPMFDGVKPILTVRH